MRNLSLFHSGSLILSLFHCVSVIRGRLVPLKALKSAEDVFVSQRFTHPPFPSAFRGSQKCGTCFSFIHSH